MMLQKKVYSLGLLRISLGLIFLWAFFDKLFGLGFTTTVDKAWIAGVSPTTGFLTKVAYGPLAPFYKFIATLAITDWIFMLSLLFIGLTLTLGIMVKLGSYVGSLLVFMMWTALLPPQHHPFLDEHIIYLFVFLVLAAYNAGTVLGLGEWWSRCRIVEKYPLLQ